MSTVPESEKNFDLDLHFLPAWAQQPSKANQFSDYQGETREGPERRGRGRDQRFGERRDRGPRREGQGGPRREGGAPGGGHPGGRDRRDRPDWRRGREPERREAPVPLPELEVAILPEERGVDALSRQIKITGRAYPLFDIGFLILKKPERYVVQFSVKKDAEGNPIQKLLLCSMDETLWLSEQEAMNYILNKHFATFYQSEKIPTDPPKGVFTFVAQCGLSGTVLGPPNYHDYQNKLRKLHAERFSHLPFEVYKSRVKIVRDEAVVKQWQEDQSFRTEYICLNVPEATRLVNREEVEKHFRETHLPNVVQSVDSYTMNGTTASTLPPGPINSLVRRAFDEQRRFPIKVVTVLSQMFASAGLHFFKVNKTVTHVAVARPRYLDLNTTPVSEGIKTIISYINEHPQTNRRKLVEALSPAPAPAPETVVTSETEAPAPAPAAETPAGGSAPGETALSSTSPEVTAVVSNLHWLIHQGYVIEFANGILETAKMPPPKPPRPEKEKKAPAPAEAAPAQENQAAPEAAPESAPAAEAAVEVAAETADQQPSETAVTESPVSAGPSPDEPSPETAPAQEQAPDLTEEKPASSETQTSPSA